MSDNLVHVLLIEDNPGDSRLVEEMLSASSHERFHLSCVQSIQEALTLSEKDRFDVALVDLTLGDATGLEAVEEVYFAFDHVPLVVLTGSDNVELAMRALQSGAQDYLVKDHIDTQALSSAIRHAVERVRLQLEIQEIRELLTQTQGDGSSGGKGETETSPSGAESDATVEPHQDEFQQFLYAISHDMHEPLRMVSSYMQLLARRYGDKLDESANEFIDFAVDGAHRMQRMLDDLLTFSRVATQGAELATCSADSALQAALQRLAKPIEDAGVHVQRDPLPTVLADEKQLAQVFHLLLDNAIRFRRETSPEIRVGVERQAGDWHIAVADNGPGIASNQLERVFEVFHKLGEGEPAGTGMGLPIARRIVERHNGRLWAQSDGSGATLHFTLPALHDD